jgi:uncharacterized protein (TIGR04255 family)
MPLRAFEPLANFTLHFTVGQSPAKLKRVDHDNPALAASPQEVPLPDAPLVRVIVQVRFPLVVSVERREFIGSFQEALRPAYPVLRPEQTQSLLVTQTGLAPAQPKITWRFSDIEGNWRVSLAPDFVALETTAYRSRADLLGRLRTVLEALHRHVGPALVDRLGVRYIDRVTGTALEQIRDLVRAEVRGIAGTPAAQQLQHTLTESLFTVGSAQVLTRWGTLPAATTSDSAAIEPIDEPSWILDLDMFRVEPAAFDVERLLIDTSGFCERLYTFFRWAVTDAFLRRYGGKP